MNTKRLRTIIPLAVIAVVAVGFATHVGVGTLSAIGWQDISLLCPLGALMTMIATKTMIPRAVISVVIAIALILLFARAFCGWVCPVPVVSKIRGIFSKKTSNTDMTGTGVLPASENPLVKAAVADGAGAGTEPRPSPAPLSADEQAALKGCGSKAGCSSCAEKRAALDSRHVILGGSLLSAAVFGFPVFCLICPIGLTFATIVLVMRLFAFGDVAWGVILVPALLLAEVVFFRKWCSTVLPHKRAHEPRGQGEPHLRARHRQCEMPRERPGHPLRGMRSRVPPGHQRAASRGRHELLGMHQVPRLRGGLPHTCHHHAVSAEESGAFHRCRGGRRDRAGSLGQARSRRHPSCDASGARVSATPRPGKIALRGLSPSACRPGPADGERHVERALCGREECYDVGTCPHPDRCAC